MEKNLLISRKESIVLAAIEAIDKSGIQAFSTREIAKGLKISESNIFKHFPKKTDLLEAVLDYFCQYDKAIIETSYAKKLQPRQSIMYFIDSFLLYYENYPAITALTQSFDIIGRELALRDKVREIRDKREAFIREQIQRTQSTGNIRADMESEYLAEIIMGTLREGYLKWRMSECRFPLRERMTQTLNLILDMSGIV